MSNGFDFVGFLLEQVYDTEMYNQLKCHVQASFNVSSLYVGCLNVRILRSRDGEGIFQDTFEMDCVSH